MANIIIPLVTSVLFTGMTVDIKSIEDPSSFQAPRIFNETDTVETPLDILNTSYYVLQDDSLPYAAMGLPIDYAIRLKHVQSSFRKWRLLTSLQYRRVAVLFTAEYKKVERSLDKTALPLPDWQKKLRKGHTHYADKAYYGGRFFALVQLTSNFSGDIQVIRKKLTEIMGVSGKITKDTYDLWTNALETFRTTPELRGNLEFSNFVTDAKGVIFPSSPGSYDFLKYLPDLSNYVKAPEPNEAPLSVSLKPLHDLDEQFPAVEKNLETEKYLQKADELYEDLTNTREKVKSIIDVIFELHPDDDDMYDGWYSKISKLTDVFRRLDFRWTSMYQKLNTSAYDAAFEEYYRGLDNGTDNYYDALLKFYEDNSVQCSNDFLKPIKGILRVQANEIYKKGIIEGGLKECLQECLKDGRCKAVGFKEFVKTPLFGGNKQLCWIYYRGTVTAKIGVPIPSFSDMTIHERDCKFMRL